MGRFWSGLTFRGRCFLLFGFAVYLALGQWFGWPIATGILICAAAVFGAAKFGGIPNFLGLLLLLTMVTVLFYLAALTGGGSGIFYLGLSLSR